MKEIKLTQEKVALVDDEDFEYLNQWKWFAHRTAKKYYARRSIKNGNSYLTILMHRVILKTPKNMGIDHIDHNTLNNQKFNLRVCTRSQNNCNSESVNYSGYRGVTYNKGKYIVAQIKVDNKMIRIGTFKSEIEAACAYDEAAIKYHGKFAILNFKKDKK